jgi:DNA-directed RNA polymerase specialized sigma24 family protein
MRQRKAHSQRSLAIAACVAVVTAMNTAPTQAEQDRAYDQISRYCSVCWRNAGVDPQQYDDLTHDVIAELLERISSRELPLAINERDSTQHRELKRSVWRVAQRWRRRHKSVNFYEGFDCEDNAIRPRSDADENWAEIGAMSERWLSSRQCSILRLSRDGFAASEIANELAISPERVSDQKYKAIQRLREVLASDS